MSQLRYNEYNTPLDSNPANREFLGKFFPGRFCGFDTISNLSGATFDIAHDLTGLASVDSAGVLQPKLGMVVTKQGITVVETAAITGLTLATNAANPANRIDLLVCNHSYALTTGGVAATFSIVQGPNNNYVKPALATNQVEVAAFHLLAGQTADTALALMAAGTQDFIPAVVPDMGGTVSAKLPDYNKFLKRLDTADGVTATYLTLSGSYCNLKIPKTSNTLLHNDNGGSSFYICGLQDPTGSSGCRIFFKVKEGGSDDFVIVNNYGSPVGTGYSKVIVPTDFLNSTGTPAGTILFSGDMAEFVYANSVWNLVNIVRVNASTPEFFDAKGKIAQGLKVINLSGAQTSHSSGLVSFDAGANTFTLNSNYLTITGNKIKVVKAGKYRLSVNYLISHNGIAATQAVFLMDVFGSVSTNGHQAQVHMAVASQYIKVAHGSFNKIISCSVNDEFGLTYSLSTTGGSITDPTLSVYVTLEFLGV